MSVAAPMAQAVVGNVVEDNPKPPQENPESLETNSFPGARSGGSACHAFGEPNLPTRFWQAGHIFLNLSTAVTTRTSPSTAPERRS